MAGRYADTRYDPNAPGAQSAGYAAVSSSGYSSNEERLVSEALLAQTEVDPELLRTMRPSSRSPLFPPRFVGERTQPTLDDVVMVDRSYPDSSAQFSGSSGGYSGSSTPSLGWW
jgi:hypothetical protein